MGNQPAFGEVGARVEAVDRNTGDGLLHGRNQGVGVTSVVTMPSTFESIAFWIARPLGGFGSAEYFSVGSVFGGLLAPA
jgi:hypothetical protein